MFWIKISTWITWALFTKNTHEQETDTDEVKDE